MMRKPTLDPYYIKLERFELFSTSQCYYLVACDKHNSFYRVLKLDRTLIERPPDYQRKSSNTSQTSSPPQQEYGGGSSSQYGGSVATDSASHTSGTASHQQKHNPSSSSAGDPNTRQSATTDQSQQHTPKPTLRPLKDFLSEDPNIYSQDEIKDMLDMIHDGNRMAAQQQQSTSPRNSKDHMNTGTSINSGVPGTGGLKPMVKAYGIVGFIRFLDNYYLTLVTKRSKVGSLGGGHGIYTIKNTETIALKPAQGQYQQQQAQHVQPQVSGHGSSSMWTASASGTNNNGTAAGSSGGSVAHHQDDSSAVASATADPSSVLLSMWNRGKRSVGLGLSNREIAELRYQGLYQVVDLQKHFFFSYTYDLTRSLQENFLATTAQPFPPPPFKEMYAWNHFLTREFEACLDPLTSFYWIMPIIHGSFVQRKVIDYGKSLNLILLARRSRHFAGTRYLKRGVSEEGKVANDVEHEQIVNDESVSCAVGMFSSYLQMRGSIPTFWTQESSVTMPKPPIEINRVDPTYSATQAHFEDLLKRYSYPVVVLDLVKQSEKREREVRVGNEFRHAIDYINQSMDDERRIRYCALDYSHISKHRNLDVSASLNEVSTWAVNQTGFFCSAPKWKIVSEGAIKPFTDEDTKGATHLSEELGVPVFPMEQSGILRTNCIDCLDRTNVAQFSAGVDAIGQQLVVMGIRSKLKLDPSSNIVRVLIDMYVEVGDSIALQYGGSEAHKKVTATRNESTMNISGPIGKHKELLTSIRRYYSNAFTDRLKQDAMNLFLGYYIPYHHAVPLWEMETDFYLHNFHVKADKGTMYSMKTYERNFGVDWQSNDIQTAEPVASLNLLRNFRTRQSGSHHEPRSIIMVRNRCQLQSSTLSSWWKVALQSYIQERMLFQLCPNEIDATVPSRFDRLYQPEKLSQFDRLFTRGWATPVRRSHTAQQTDGPDIDNDSGSLTHLTRLAHQGSPPRSCEQSIVRPDYDETIGAYVEANGLEPHFKTFLDSYLCHARNKARVTSSTRYAALDTPSQVVNREYADYAAKPNPMYSSFDMDKIEEYKSCLHDNCLLSDDVAGIRKLSESAHVGDVILSGQYTGLRKDMSAIQVATAIHEQYNAFQSIYGCGDKKPDAGLYTSGRSLAEMELERQGIGSNGVLRSVRDGWNKLKTADIQYNEIVSGGADQCRRSDLTTAESLRLYVSSVDKPTSTKLTVAEEHFLSGTRIDRQQLSPSYPFDAVSCTDSLIQKANLLGIPVIPRANFNRTKDESMFQYGRIRDVPMGWEQINEDMFAKKENKFMVLNGAGIDSWTGSQPVTKTTEIRGSAFYAADALSGH